MPATPREGRCAFDAAVDGRRIIAGKKARLQLADPVHSRRPAPECEFFSRCGFEPAFVEPVIVEGAEDRRQAAQGPDQLELRGDDVDDETELRLPREVEAASASRCTSASGSPLARRFVISVLQL